MSKLMRDLGPLAVATAIFGVVIALLLQAGHPLGNWLFAAFLAGHGFVHMMYVMPQPQAQTAESGGRGAQTWPFRLDRSWLLSGVGVGTSTLRPIGVLLAVATMASYALTALATIPLVLPTSAWAPLVLVSTVASALLLGLFANRNLLIGLAIDVVLLAVVLTNLWVPAV